MTIPHPVLKYYGSKFRLSKWIISHFPEHRHYVEPFGGAANVLLQKEPARVETYNDLNDALVTFFRVLRDRPDELVDKIIKTPWARSEFAYCISDVPAADEIEVARRLYYRLWMNYNSTFVTTVANYRRATNAKRAVLNDIKPDILFQASKRLLKVQIEKRDAFKLIAEMDSPDTLFYLDPPYVTSTRQQKKAYTNEMTDRDHEEFAELLHSLKGYVILSGYPSANYNELFERKGWRRADRQALTMGKTHKTECIWISPNVPGDLGLAP
jgi:DNA adenine methylase